MQCMCAIVCANADSTVLAWLVLISASITIDSRGERDWKRAHVMLYVTPLRGISFDVGAFRRDPVRVQNSTMLMTSFHEYI